MDITILADLNLCTRADIIECIECNTGKPIADIIIPNKKPKQKRRIIDSEKAMSLYRQGMSDYEIAKILCFTPNAIQLWRFRNNLKSNNPPVRQYTHKFDTTTIAKLYEQGRSDVEIAKEIGVSPRSISNFRRKFNMPQNKHAGVSGDG